MKPLIMIFVSLALVAMLDGMHGRPAQQGDPHGGELPEPAGQHGDPQGPDPSSLAHQGPKN